MTSYFAGFYCTPTELAENAAAQKPINIAFSLVALGYFGSIFILSKQYSHFSKGQRITTWTLTPLIGVLVLAGFFYLSFSLTPHLCGNG
jgi:hypothetical protein